MNSWRVTLCYLVFAFLCWGVAAYAFDYLYRDVDIRDPFMLKFSLQNLAVPMHFFASALALTLCPVQISPRLRKSAPSLHRSCGLLYVAAVWLGAIAGFLLALDAEGGKAAGSGFALLAIVWISITTSAFVHALKGDIERHRRWMYRSVALTTSAITLRVMLGFGIGVLHLPFLVVYTASAWLCWLINLMVCEVLLHLRMAPQAQSNGDPQKRTHLTDTHNV